MVMSSRSALFLRRGWLLKSAKTSVAVSIRKGFNMPFCPLALSRKGHVSSTINWTLLSQRDRASAWRSTRLWLKEPHPVFVQDIAWRRVVSCRQPLPRHILQTNLVASCDPRLLAKVSLYRGPSKIAFCEPQAFHRGHGALFPRSRKPCCNSFHCRVVQVLGTLQELLPMVHVEGAREL